MRPVDFIAQANSEMSGMAQEWISLGSAVDGLGESNTTGTEANQMIGPIGRSDVFTGTDLTIREREYAFA